MLNQKNSYLINIFIFIYHLLAFNLFLNAQPQNYPVKQGGICFRTDDDQPIENYYEYSNLFNNYNKNFCFAINLGSYQITDEYVAMLDSLQTHGHEMMDHTPWHNTIRFSTKLGTEYFENHPGVERIYGNEIELKHENVDTNLAIRTGTVSIIGDIITSTEGVFADFEKSDCYIYFPSLDQLVFINEYGFGWIDDHHVRVEDYWHNSIDLGQHENIIFYNFNHYDIHLTNAAIKALAEESLRLSEYYGLIRPYTWIQPGGLFPYAYRNEVKEALSGDLGYLSASIYPDLSFKVFNEYNPDNDKQFGMDWGDFQEDTWTLEQCKARIADQVAKHHVLMGNSHFSWGTLLGGWDGFLERTEGLLKWCIAEDIPIRTYIEWTDILYNQIPDPYENIFPHLDTDKDSNGVPDGYAERSWKYDGEWVKDDGVPESNNHSFSIDRVGGICHVGRTNWWENDGLGGVEKGENEFEIWTKGTPGNFIEVVFKIESGDQTYKFPAEKSDWTKYTLSQSINGNTSLIIPDYISIIDIDIYCSDYSSGDVKVSGMRLTKKLLLQEFSIDLKVFLEGAYVNNNRMGTDINSSIPMEQPFSDPPSNYPGSETLESAPNPEIVDWVLVSFYKSPDNGSTFDYITSKPCFVLSDGHVADLDGANPIKIDLFPGEYYIKIEHRNHLAVFSSQPIFLN